MGTIYILENKVNGKYYVGQTTQVFYKRMREHCKNKKFYIGNALRKYGEENFSKLLLENVPDEELNYWEIHYIQECNSVSPFGYNLTYGGESGRKSEETRKKMSEEHKGEKNHMFGKHPTEEYKKKLSEAHKGQIPWNKGKRYTEEDKLKMSRYKKTVVSIT